MRFSVADAMRVATATLDARAKNRKVSTMYTLYYTNEQNRYDGRIHGSTIAGLRAEFTQLGSAYRYAFITPKDSDKTIAFFDRARCGKDKKGLYKFFSLTRKGRSK